MIDPPRSLDTPIVVYRKLCIFCLFGALACGTSESPQSPDTGGSEPVDMGMMGHDGGRARDVGALDGGPAADLGEKPNLGIDGGVGIVQAPQQVAAGGRFSAAVDEDGQAWTFGSNGQGELGIDEDSFSRPFEGKAYAPIRPLDLQGVSALAAGRAHVLALDAQGQVWAWGENDAGQLGHQARDFVSGRGRMSFVPRPVVRLPN